MSTDDGRLLITWDEPESGGEAEEYRLWFVPVVADETTNSFYNVASYAGEREFEITYMVRFLGASFTVQVRAGNRIGFSPWSDKATFVAPTSTTTTVSTSTTATTSTTSSTSSSTTTTVAA